MGCKQTTAKIPRNGCKGSYVMTDTIETQLRTQLQKQLDEKRGRLEQVQQAETAMKSQISEIESKISKFDEVFGTSEPTSTVRKPGPKPRAQVAKTAGVKTHAKPGPKPKAQAAAKSVKGNSRATQGRRDVAKGLRPSLKESMTQVMGSKTMNASEVFEGLKAKDWLPNSSDPRQYISYSLSSFKDRFERVESKGRGFYKVRAGASASPNGNGGPAKAAKAAKAEKNETETEKAPLAVSTTESDVDALLQDAGVLPSVASATN